MFKARRDFRSALSGPVDSTFRNVTQDFHPKATESALALALVADLGDFRQPVANAPRRQSSHRRDILISHLEAPIPVQLN
jgi:hypothetical protein